MDITKEHIAEQAIKSVQQVISDDPHAIFTPFELCDEIVSKIPSLDGKILVVSNLEFVYTIKSTGKDMGDVYFATPCEKKGRLASKWIPKSNIITYKTIITKQDVGEMKFDVVVGNPPYQDSTGTSTSNSNLWVKISQMCFSILSESGHIAFVTPASWMKPNHKLLKWFKSHSLLHVSTKISHHFPGVGSTFSYWIASNSAANISTCVDDYSVDIKKVPYLVGNDKWSIHEKVVFNTTDKFAIDSDQKTAYTLKLTKKSPDLSKEKNAKCIYPIMHTNVQTIYSAYKTKNFNDKKVMFSDSGYFRPKYNSGGLGSSQRCYYILVDEDNIGVNLASILSLNLYQFIVNTAKWSGFSDLTVLRSLPAVDLTRSWTDAELYEHFNLTEEEIKLIEDTIK